MSIISSVLKTILGDKSAKDRKLIWPIVESINVFQKTLAEKSDEQLKGIYKNLKIELSDIIKLNKTSGELIENSDTLVVVVSKGKPPDYYVVPDLLNMLTLASVKRKLDKNGLILGRISYRYIDPCNCSDDLLEGTVVDQSPDYNIRLSLVRPVDITIIKYNEE